MYYVALFYLLNILINGYQYMGVLFLHFKKRGKYVTANRDKRTMN